MPQYYVSGGSSITIDTVKIAITYSRLRENIKTVLEQTKVDLEKKGLRAIVLRNIVPRFRRLGYLKLDDKIESIEFELKIAREPISSVLGGYKGKILNWLLNEGQAGRDEIDKLTPNGNSYQSLFRLEDYLEFNAIVRISEIDLQLLQIFCDIIDYPDDNPVNIATSKIKKLLEKTSSPPTPLFRLSPPNVVSGPAW
jgi:hypothetical protein